MDLETVVNVPGSIDQGNAENQARVINTQLPPVSPLCEAIAVVPVYREFKGGRIMKLLSELQAQNIGSRRFEAILVVNNTPTADPSGFAGFLDNLEFLTEIDKQKRAGYFPNVHVLDCISGQIPERHMGLVRGLGQLVAETRLDQTKKGEQGIIIQLDADVSVERDFVAKLLNAYQDPVVHSAMVGRIPLPIDFLSDDYYLLYARKFAGAVESHLTGEATYLGDGPTLSFRAFLHKKHDIRKYMGREISEDFKLGRCLATDRGMYLLAEPRVYKADRIRPDGFDSAGRKIWVSIGGPYWQTIELLIGHACGDFSVAKRQYETMPQSEFWRMVSNQLQAAQPEAAANLQRYLVREEELARRSMDWEALNPQLRDPALHLYALSRLAMGEEQKVSLPAKKEGDGIYTQIIHKDLNSSQFADKLFSTRMAALY